MTEENKVKDTQNMFVSEVPYHICIPRCGRYDLEFIYKKRGPTESAMYPSNMTAENLQLENIISEFH